MLNLLKKTTALMLASVLVATTAFGQDNPADALVAKCAPESAPKTTPKNGSKGSKCAPKCEPKPCAQPCPQPTPPTQMCSQGPCCPAWPTPVLNAGYGYPAHIQTRCPQNINVDFSVIFWQPVMRNLELGTLINAPAAGSTGVKTHLLNMGFDYKAGFKLGMGGYFDYDDWDMHFGYTWFRSTQSEKETASGEDAIFPVTNFAVVTANPSSPILYKSVKGNWDLKMDILDLDLGRWYYLGTKLTARPYAGLRAAWIGQKAHFKYQNPIDDYTLSAKTSSWALGAKTGVDTNWELGAGFRLFGCGEADLLFTQYTGLSTKSEHVLAAGNETITAPNLSVRQNRVYAVNPHVDLELGFGWGTYLDCNRWYLDFALGYGFQVFFDQNMFRHFVSPENNVGNSHMPNGNLYIQGLTFTSKLDF